MKYVKTHLLCCFKRSKVDRPLANTGPAKKRAFLHRAKHGPCQRMPLAKLLSTLAAPSRRHPLFQTRLQTRRLFV
ncbi:unnamed protein product [Protopolystoma xenopodis]|uniref:Uncharacterized protein n=1 Tax=Protopolystoma xenopodis TaxID=117903 RepID=A0A3S5CS17_9PLAT|nr:unnamed protein product [Protopolystoma xenopodis]